MERKEREAIIKEAQASVKSLCKSGKYANYKSERLEQTRKDICDMWEAVLARYEVAK